MYYLMGCRSIQLNAEYDFKNKIKKIGFFNPRLSKVYIMPVSSIDDATKLEVEKDVIGYNEIARRTLGRKLFITRSIGKSVRTLCLNLTYRISISKRS